MVLDLGETIITGGSISDELSLPDWEILDYHVSAKPYSPISGISAAGFSFVFTAKRYFVYYLWQVIVPLGVVVFMSWSALWIDPEQPGARIGVASSAILTLIAYKFVL